VLAVDNKEINIIDAELAALGGRRQRGRLIFTLDAGQVKPARRLLYSAPIAAVQRFRYLDSITHQEHGHSR